LFEHILKACTHKKPSDSYQDGGAGKYLFPALVNQVETTGKCEFPAMVKKWGRAVLENLLKHPS
jgi:hypothetical protein